MLADNWTVLATFATILGMIASIVLLDALDSIRVTRTGDLVVVMALTSFITTCVVASIALFLAYGPIARCPVALPVPARTTYDRHVQPVPSYAEPLPDSPAATLAWMGHELRGQDEEPPVIAAGPTSYTLHQEEPPKMNSDSNAGGM